MLSSVDTADILWDLAGALTKIADGLSGRVPEAEAGGTDREASHLQVAGSGDGEPWMKKTQAAAYLGVDPRTITNWQRDLWLPHRKVGGINLYKKSELDAWVEAQDA